jgi:hypothetical protein
VRQNARLRHSLQKRRFLGRNTAIETAIHTSVILKTKRPSAGFSWETALPLWQRAIGCMTDDEMDSPDSAGAYSTTLDFRGLMGGPVGSMSTLRLAPRDAPRMTRASLCDSYPVKDSHSFIFDHVPAF